MTDGRSGGRRKGTGKKTGGGKPPVLSVRSGYLELAMWDSEGRGPNIKLQKRIPPRDDSSDKTWRDMGSIWLFDNEVEDNLTEIMDTFLDKKTAYDDEE